MKILQGKEKDFSDNKEKYNDEYVAATFRYAEAWANIMEDEIASGKKIKDFANSTSHLADVEGITGHMYYMAIGILAQFWLHGEELRVWHNKDIDETMNRM